MKLMKRCARSGRGVLQHHHIVHRQDIAFFLRLVSQLEWTFGVLRILLRLEQIVGIAVGHPDIADGQFLDITLVIEGGPVGLGLADHFSGGFPVGGEVELASLPR